MKKLILLLVVLSFVEELYSQDREFNQMESFLVKDSVGTDLNFTKVYLLVGVHGEFNINIDGVEVYKGEVKKGKNGLIGNNFVIDHCYIKPNSEIEIITQKWSSKNKFEFGYKYLFIVKAFGECMFNYSNEIGEAYYEC